LQISHRPVNLLYLITLLSKHLSTTSLLISSSPSEPQYPSLHYIYGMICRLPSTLLVLNHNRKSLTTSSFGSYVYRPQVFHSNLKCHLFKNSHTRLPSQIFHHPANLLYLIILLSNGVCGAWWLIGEFGALPRFDSHSSRHVDRDLGQVLHSQLPVALRRVNSDSVNDVAGSTSE